VQPRGLNTHPRVRFGLDQTTRESHAERPVGGGDREGDQRPAPASVGDGGVEHTLSEVIAVSHQEHEGRRVEGERVRCLLIDQAPPGEPALCHDGGAFGGRPQRRLPQ
jgi:hypothetical protein